MSAQIPAKILAIDDDEMALVIMRKLLEAEDCSVEVLTSPREALAKLAGKPLRRHPLRYVDG